MTIPSTSVIAASGTGLRRGAVVGDAGVGGAASGPRTAAGDDRVAWPVVSVCSARENSATLLNRSAGTVESAFRIARSTDSGTLGRTERALGGGSVRRLTSIACVVAPVNGGSPTSAS